MKKQHHSQKAAQNRRILARRATLELSNDALKKVAGGFHTTFSRPTNLISDDSEDRPAY